MSNGRKQTNPCGNVWNGGFQIGVVVKPCGKPKKVRLLLGSMGLALPNLHLGWTIEGHAILVGGGKPYLRQSSCSVGGVFPKGHSIKSSCRRGKNRGGPKGLHFRALGLLAPSLHLLYHLL